MRRAVLALAAGAGIAVGAGGLFLPARATQVVATVGDSVEAWYHANPSVVCTAISGCPTSDASQYEAATLHVGVLLGNETDRTYVMPDLAGLPPETPLSSAQMTLPVATGTNTGTSSPSSADIAACLATSAPDPEADGTTKAPPAIDKSLCLQAVYVASKGEFTLDLAPFFAAWAAGRPQDGIALIPDTANGPAPTWHVAFDAATMKGGHPITSTLVGADTSSTLPATTADSSGVPTPASGDSGTQGYTAPIVTPPPSGNVFSAAPVAGAAPLNGATSAGTQPSTAPLASGPPAGSGTGAPTQAPTQRATLAGFHTDRKTLYLAIFVAPLFLVAAFLFFTRLFIRPLDLGSTPTETLP